MTSREQVKHGRVVVECLRCGHIGVLDDRILSEHGERPDAPIAAFAQRLTCSKCGSHSVRAFRDALSDPPDDEPAGH